MTLVPVDLDVELDQTQSILLRRRSSSIQRDSGLTGGERRLVSHIGKMLRLTLALTLTTLLPKWYTARTELRMGPSSRTRMEVASISVLVSRWNTSTSQASQLFGLIVHLFRSAHTANVRSRGHHARVLEDDEAGVLVRQNEFTVELLVNDARDAAFFRNDNMQLVRRQDMVGAGEASCIEVKRDCQESCPWLA